MTSCNAIALWNFAWNAPDVPAWIEGFARDGFGAVSLHPDQVGAWSAGLKADVVRCLRELDLPVTIHGHARLDEKTVHGLVQAFGDRLLCFTMDGASREDSRGTWHDVARMGRVLGWIESATRGTQVRFGVEDFPLDRAALEAYGDALTPWLATGRFGMLLDLGHMLLRRRRSDYFGARSVAEYIGSIPLPIVEVHIHDNGGEKDEHRALGEGTLDVHGAAAALRTAGFAGVSTVEIAPSLHGSTPQADRPGAVDTLRRWRAAWGRA